MKGKKLKEIDVELKRLGGLACFPRVAHIYTEVRK
jgi:hypothetical protein